MLAIDIGSNMIVGQYGIGVIDGPDEDKKQDIIPLSGTITFSPSITNIIAGTPGESVGIALAVVKGVLDEEGWLCTPGPDGVTPMYRGVSLFATDGSGMSNKNWTWSVVYRFGVINGATPTIPAHALSVTTNVLGPEDEINLPDFAPVPSSPGIGTPQALALLARAEAAADASATNALQAAAVALQVKADADSGKFNGTPGAPGNPGDPGKDGSNVIPTDQAIAGNILDPQTETARALSGTIGDQINSRAEAQMRIENINDFSLGALTPTTWETPDGTGVVVHPSARYFPNGFNGHHWWAAITPYFNANNQVEDPCILVSEDGTNWVSPEGVDNPLWPAQPGGYNSDTHLTQGPDGKLYLFFRDFSTSELPTEKIRCFISDNGIDWTGPTTVTAAGSETRRLMSPAVWWDAGENRWVMLAVEITSVPTQIFRLTAPAALGPWTKDASPATISPAWPTGRAPWHLDAMPFGSQIVALIQESQGGTSAGGNIYLAVSDDAGRTFTRADSPLATGGLYRSCLLPKITESGLSLDVWVGKHGGSWGVNRGTASKRIKDSATTAEVVALLAKALAPKPAVSPGMVSLGDSITIGMNSATGAADSWPTYAGAISKQKLRLIRNSGVGGNTTAQMLARFTADVSAHAPKMVPLLAGSNDLMQSVPQTTLRANYEQLVANIRAIGAEPIILTVPPRIGGEALVTAHNDWLRGYALVNGLRLVDMYAVLANGTAWKAGFNSGDGTHPSPAGYAAMGAEFDRVITPALGTPFSPNLTTTQADAENLLTNGIFTVGGANVGASWTPYGPGANLTYSLEAADVGNWQVLNVTTGGAGVGLAQTSTAGAKWNPGDRVRFMLRATVPQGGNLSCSLVFTGGAGGTYQAARNITQPINDGLFMIEFTIPAGTTSCNALLLASTVGVYKIAQATWRKIS